MSGKGEPTPFTWLERNPDIVFLLGGIVFDGLYYLWRARLNSGDWDWLLAVAAVVILGITVFGSLWRHGIVTLEIGIVMQTLVFVSYREAVRFHFAGYVSVRAIIRNTVLITAALIETMDAVLKGYEAHAHRKHSLDQ